jgi:hypothetical protein
VQKPFRHSTKPSRQAGTHLRDSRLVFPILWLLNCLSQPHTRYEQFLLHFSSSTDACLLSISTPSRTHAPFSYHTNRFPILPSFGSSRMLVPSSPISQTVYIPPTPSMLLHKPNLQPSLRMDFGMVCTSSYVEKHSCYIINFTSQCRGNITSKHGK